MNLGGLVWQQFGTATAIACALILSASTQLQAEVKVSEFGKTADGTPVEEFTLTNSTGAIVKLISRGATLNEWHVPDKNGEVADVVFGFDDVAGYESPANGYFGCTTGRVANRIARRQVHARRQGIHARHQQRPQRTPRRREAQPRQGRLEGQAVRIGRRRRRRLHLHQPRRRRRLPRQARHEGHLHAHRQERAPHRLRSDDRQSHAGQSHQPRLLQSRRRRLADDQRPRADARRRPLHAGRQHADPHRRDRLRSRARRSTSASRTRSASGSTSSAPAPAPATTTTSCSTTRTATSPWPPRSATRSPAAC